MNRPQALTLLSLSDQPSPEDVRAAFKRLSRQLVAPRADDVTEPFHSIDDLRAARDMLTISTENDFPPCLICRGRGKVQSGFNAQPCVACAGSGDRRV